MTKLKPYTEYSSVRYDYVTELPVGWQLLPNIAIFQERIERGYEKEELLSVTIGRGVIKQSDLDKKDSSTLDKSKYLLVYPNDLVYSMRFRQGASGYSNYKGIVSPACTVLKPRKNIKLNSRYYYYMLRTGFYKNYAERYAYGIADGQMPLRYTDFKRMYSIVPPLETQNRIVEYLDKKNAKIDKFIRNKERLIQILDEQKKSEITRIIVEGIDEKNHIETTNVPYMPYKNTNSIIKRIKHLASLKGRIGFHGLNTSDFLDEGPYLITGTDFLDGKVNWETSVHISMKRYKEDPYIQLKEGDFLITKDGTIGKTAIVENLPYEASLNSGVMLIRALRGDFINKYLFWIINSMLFDEFVEITKTGSTVMHLYQNSFGNFKIPIYSIEIQKLIVTEIETIVSKIELAISKAQKEISSIKEYREALITDLVTGKRSVPQ
jgi:type I restriction enzyme S subunit